VADDFVDTTFPSNHDQNRITSMLGEPAQVRVAANLLLTLLGAPYLHPGKETGCWAGSRTRTSASRS
jgi:alpha-amylase